MAINSINTSDKDRLYKCFIVCSDKNIEVAAWLPANFSLDIKSDYDTPFAQSAVGNEVLKMGLGASGISAVNQSMTMQVWQGSAPIEFELQLQFVAESNTWNDVIKPIQDLMALASPSDDGPGGLYQSPGPNIDWSAVGKALKDAVTSLGVDSSGFTSTDSKGNKQSSGTVFKSINDALKKMDNKISVQIGNFLYLDEVVVLGVSQQYDTQFDVEGGAMRASVTVSFRTFYTPTIRDLKRYFINKGPQSGGNA